nr:autotransporter-associated beta strand repeat-containing protein [Opitutaceae bacterium]
GGETLINTGTVVLRASTALGATTAGTRVASGATLSLENNIAVGAEALVLDGTLRQASGTNSYGGAISGGGEVRVAGGQLTFSGASANTYSGGTVIDAGTVVLSKSAGVTALPGAVTVGDGSGSATLRLAAANQISDGARVTLAATGTPVFDLAGNAETIGSLASANTAAAVTLGSATLATGADNTSTTFAGVISGTGGLAKQGSGMLTLTGTSTYTGGTTVSAGTLALGASNRLADTSALSLAGGTLALGGTASERVGALSYTDGGVLDFGAIGTANHLLFASAGSATGTLTVRNFSENIDVFGSASATVDAAFLDNIFFDGLGVGIGAQIDTTTTNVAGYGNFYAIRPIETFVWTGGAGGSNITNWSKNDNWANEPSAPGSTPTARSSLPARPTWPTTRMAPTSCAACCSRPTPAPSCSPPPAARASRSTAAASSTPPRPPRRSTLASSPAPTRRGPPRPATSWLVARPSRSARARSP